MDSGGGLSGGRLWADGVSVAGVPPRLHSPGPDGASASLLGFGRGEHLPVRSKSCGVVVGRQRLELWTRGLKVPFRAIRTNTNQQPKPHRSRGLRVFFRPLLLAVLGGS